MEKAKSSSKAVLAVDEVLKQLSEAVRELKTEPETAQEAAQESLFEWHAHEEQLLQQARAEFALESMQFIHLRAVSLCNSYQLNIIYVIVNIYV